MSFPRLKQTLLMAAAAWSTIILALVYFLLAVVLCIVRVPDTHAAVLYVSVLEGAMALGVSAMIVSFSEEAINRITVMLAFWRQGRSELEAAMTLYFTRATQEIDLSICTGTQLKLMMDSQLQYQSSMHACVNAVQAKLNEFVHNNQQLIHGQVAANTPSTCNINQPLPPVAVVSAHENEISTSAAASTMAKMQCGDISPETGSSVCSAASTD